MSEQLFIDGKEVDVMGRIAVTIESIDLRDLTKTRGTYSVKVKLANSQNNEKVVDSPQNIELQDPDIYKQSTAQVLSSGIPIIQTGQAVLVDASKDGYSMNIIEQTSNLYNKLSQLRLSDIEWGSDNQFSHNATWPSFIKFPSIETWINVDFSSLGVYGNFNPYRRSAFTKYGIPFIRKRRVFREIIEQAGYTLSDDLVTNHSGHYNNSWVSLQVPEGKLNHFDEPDIVISEWMHDESQLDFVTSVLMQYGCVLLLSGNRATVMPIREIAGQKALSHDWSGTIDSSTIQVSYDLGYKINNYLNYRNWETDLLGYMAATIDTNYSIATNQTGDRSGLIECNNLNLTGRKDIATYIFHPLMEINVENTEAQVRRIGYIPCFEWKNEEGDDVYSFKQTYPITDILIPSTATTFKKLDTTNEVWFGDLSNGTIYPAYWAEQQQSNATITTSNSNYGLSPEKLINYWWEGYSEFIKRPVMVKAKFNLRTVDVLNYTEGAQFSSEINQYIKKSIPIYVSELGGHFIVSRISNYVAGQPCSVELIRI